LPTTRETLLISVSPIISREWLETLIQQAVQLYENASGALEQGDFARSEALHLECIALFQQASGPNSLDAASVYTALADLRQQVGNLDGCGGYFSHP
jgi:hypothetical protein